MPVFDRINFITNANYYWLPTILNTRKTMTKVDEHLGRIEGRKYCSNCPTYSVKRALLNDTPAMITWFFGSIIMYNFGLTIMILYILSCGLYVLGFAKLLCVYCPLYGTTSCTTRFGDIAAKLFKKRDDTLFPKKFKTFMPLLSLLWFIPFIAGIYLLTQSFSWFLFWMVIIFSIFGFILVPFIPMLTYCKKCPLRKECPWQALAE